MIYNAFLSAKSFDIEDDLMFCPAVLDSLPTPPPTTHATANTTNISLNSTSTSTSTPNTTTTTIINTNTNSTTTPITPLAITPRSKKALDIINPLTGQRVASPKH